jgi:hypothetical protein
VRRRSIVRAIAMMPAVTLDENYADKAENDAIWARPLPKPRKSLTKDADFLAAQRANKLYRFYMFFALRCLE